MTRYARQYAAAVRRYAADPDDIRAFSDDRSRLVDAGWNAPVADRQMHFRGVANHDRVFADYLADHDDPREDLVRQTAEMWDTDASAEEHAERRLGSPHVFLPRRLSVPLPDRTRLSVTRMREPGQTGPPTGAEVLWTKPSAFEGSVHCGFYPVPSAIDLFARLAPEHAEAVAAFLANPHDDPDRPAGEAGGPPA